MLEKLRVAKEAALDKKAKDVILFDLQGHSDTTDFHFVCSGESERQTKAIVEEITFQLKTQYQILPRQVEGKETAQWVSLDYGAFIVHVFLDSIRHYYAIEGLWEQHQAEFE